jgi:tRNA(Ile)-lysidine synthase
MGHSPSKPNLLALPPLPKADNYVLAFSGGSDSIALLHKLVQQKPIQNKLSAIHINHQVHPESKQWAEHCLNCCQYYDIACTVKVIHTEKKDENSLRQARYRAISQHLNTLSGNSVLLTAHHLNDDIETILFRLLRGTGLKGLTGMTAYGDYLGITIFRPLINTPKSVINHYLTEHSLEWIDDDSNHDTDYDRNYIRHKIIPALTHLRPDALQRAKDSRDNLTASLNVLEHFIGNDNPLPLKQELSAQELATILYHWLSRKRLTPPHHDQLVNFAAACLTADLDKLPTLKNDHYILKLWQQNIYALRPNLLSMDTNQSHELAIHTDTFHWQHEFGQLSIKANQTITIDLSLKFNVHGEKIQRTGHSQHHRVKELLRQMQIPPWQRSRLPYIYHNNKLMAVGQIIAKDWQQWLSCHKAEYHWHPTHFIL